jgi:hypothetical protein
MYHELDMRATLDKILNDIKILKCCINNINGGGNNGISQELDPIFTQWLDTHPPITPVSVHNELTGREEWDNHPQYAQDIDMLKNLIRQDCPSVPAFSLNTLKQAKLDDTLSQYDLSGLTIDWSDGVPFTDAFSNSSINWIHFANGKSLYFGNLTDAGGIRIFLGPNPNPDEIIFDINKQPVNNPFIFPPNSVIIDVDTYAGGRPWQDIMFKPMCDSPIISQDLIDEIQKSLRELKWGNITGNINNQTDLITYLTDLQNFISTLQSNLTTLTNNLANNYFNKTQINNLLNTLQSNLTYLIDNLQHSQLGGTELPNCHPVSAITNAVEDVEQLGIEDIRIALNLGSTFNIPFMAYDKVNKVIIFSTEIIIAGNNCCTVRYWNPVTNEDGFILPLTLNTQILFLKYFDVIDKVLFQIYQNETVPTYPHGVLRYYDFTNHIIKDFMSISNTSSPPSDSIEFEDEIYFYNSGRIYKTLLFINSLGNVAGNLIAVSPTGLGLGKLFIWNDELYLLVGGSGTTVSGIWKYNGLQFSRIISRTNLPYGQVIMFNDYPHFLAGDMSLPRGGIYRMEDDSTINLVVPATYAYMRGYVNKDKLYVIAGQVSTFYTRDILMIDEDYNSEALNLPFQTIGVVSIIDSEIHSFFSYNGFLYATGTSGTWEQKKDDLTEFQKISNIDLRIPVALEMDDALYIRGRIGMVNPGLYGYSIYKLVKKFTYNVRTQTGWMDLEDIPGVGDLFGMRITNIKSNVIVNEVEYPLAIELNKPAPDNLWVQLYRRSKKKGTAYKIHQYRPIDIHNIFFPKFLIEKGSKIVLIAESQLNEMFKPTRVRGLNYWGWEDWDNYSKKSSLNPPVNISKGHRHNPLHGEKYNWVLYKFGLALYKPGIFYKKGMLYPTAFKMTNYIQTNKHIGYVNCIRREFL